MWRGFLRGCASGSMIWRVRGYCYKARIVDIDVCLVDGGLACAYGSYRVQIQNDLV